ncbi:MAG TPA: hypothetical protein PKA16_01295 [Ottowia sp.]|uniref:hypothetical protein n=1 Tax=Ottowia sp. TaxID=1898956 RepID=UPI002C94ADE0|nr:hypothetical protein [Ottowia sp.]HMN20007.1 hypothetical protein [Ottowia sp.]
MHTYPAPDTRSLRHPAHPSVVRNRAELVLLLALLMLAALALRLPPQQLPAGYHDLADRRTLLGVPHALNMLSNLAFLLLGTWGWRCLQCLRPGSIGQAQRELCSLFFGGLMLVAVCSAIYHATPGAAGLGIQRLGMCLAFASLLGLAAADRVSVRAGLVLALLASIAAPAAVLVAVASGNTTPWTVLQAGGLAILLGLMGLRPRPQALGISLFAVLGLYSLAKALEFADAAVLAWTQGLVSGHTLKHLAAAFAAWPVVHALQQAAAQSLAAEAGRASRG